MKVGFTGTAEGATLRQQVDVRLVLQMLWSIDGEFHFGDCVGADAEAFNLATWLGYKTVAHPPAVTRKRAYCKADVILPVGPYLERNRNIVDAVDVMIATPKTVVEELRSGTWSTVRYARRSFVPVFLLTP